MEYAYDNSHEKKQKRLNEITEMVRKLRKEVETNPKLKKELEKYENMLDEYAETNNQEICECGHTYEEHNYNLIKNSKFPDGKLLGNGECLGTGKEGGVSYCKCEKFVKESKEVKKDD